MNVRDCGCDRDACDHITDGPDHACRVAVPLDPCPYIRPSLARGGTVIFFGCALKD